jgi:hypothetical protein
VWEVLLQGKVIRQRPLPGLAHAFVFWGFCAFALVTINHFAEGLHVELISRGGFLGRIYFSLAAVFGVALAVSIAGLAFRRLAIRPKWLGPVSNESGFIALNFIARWGFVGVKHCSGERWEVLVLEHWEATADGRQGIWLLNPSSTSKPPSVRKSLQCGHGCSTASLDSPVYWLSKVSKNICRC